MAQFQFLRLMGSPAAMRHHSGSSRRRADRQVRPRVVPLEDRLLPSVLFVTNTMDAGAGSLRQAIHDANANPGTDTIAFEVGQGGA